MTPRKRTAPSLDVTLAEAKSIGEAMNYIFIGFKYFLIHHTGKTLLALLLMLAGPVYIGWDYFTSVKVKVEEIKPFGENVAGEAAILYASWSAQKEQPSIVIEGKDTGILFNPEWRLWVTKDNRSVIAYNTKTRRMLRAGADFLHQK